MKDICVSFLYVYCESLFAVDKSDISYSCRGELCGCGKNYILDIFFVSIDLKNSAVFALVGCGKSVITCLFGVDSVVVGLAFDCAYVLFLGVGSKVCLVAVFFAVYSGEISALCCDRLGILLGA